MDLRTATIFGQSAFPSEIQNSCMTCFLALRYHARAVQCRQARK